MSDFNKVLLLGRLVRDPELTHAGQTPKCKFRIATSREWGGRDGVEKKKETCYVDVVVWGRSGEACKRFLEKGRQVFVEGRLDYQEWEKDGQRRSKHEVVGESVQFLGGGGRPEGDKRDVKPSNDEGGFCDLPF